MPTKIAVRSPLSIRPARERDARALSLLMCENATATLAPHYSAVQMETFLSYYSVAAVLGKIRGQAVFCAVEGRRIVGTIALDGDFVVGFYTRLSHLGQGIGALLMRHLEDFAREKGFLEIRLSASPAATGFYLKFGFEALETKWMNYLGVDFEETLMAKKLSV